MSKLSTPVLKMFGSLSEIEGAIRKLQRRKDDFESLKSLKFDDQKIENSEGKFVDTILEIYGPKSPEYSRHKDHTVWNKMSQINRQTPGYFQNMFLAQLPDSVALVDGLLESLEEKKADFESTSSTGNETIQLSIDLHPIIAAACLKYVRDGYFEIAVLEASKALVNMVKAKVPNISKDGADLMFAAFHAKDMKDVPVKFNELKDESELNEQRGLGHMFVGAVMAIRNPRAHTNRPDSREDAFEYLGIINMLAKKLDAAKSA